MSTWVSAAPMIGAGSLDGFAIGALMTGACALAVAAPRRTRGGKTPSARDGALAAEEGGWLCEHVMAAESGWAEVATEAAAAGWPPALAAASGPTFAATPSGPTFAATPSETVVPELVAAAMVPGLVAEAVASALAAAPAGAVLAADAADVTPPAAAVAPAPGAVAFEASAERLAPYGEFSASRRGAAKGAGSYRSRHRLGDPVPGNMHWEGAEPGFPDPQPSGRTPGSARRTEARQMPRHAAPSIGFGSRVTGFSSRKTGQFAARALATGARG